MQRISQLAARFTSTSAKTTFTPKYSAKTNTSQYVFDFRLRDALLEIQARRPEQRIPLLKSFARNMQIDKSTRVKGVSKDDLQTFPAELTLFSDYPVVITGSLADGSGYGLVDLGGEQWVCVVPLSLEGETVVARFNRYGVCPGYFYAELITNSGVATADGSFTAHPLRIKPKCKYYASCSACQLQHISYASQTAWKQQFVRERFADFHKSIDTVQTYSILPIIESPKQFGFRTRVSLHHDSTYAGQTIREFGFNERHSARTVDIERCEVVSDELNAAIPAFKTAVRDKFAVSKDKQLGATFLVAHTLNPTPAKVLELQKQSKLDYQSPTDSTSLDTAQEWPEPGWTSSVTTDRNDIVTNVINGKVLRFPANSFFQTNSTLVPHLTAYLSTKFKSLGLKYPIKNLLDAYCGSGLFSLTIKSDNSIGIDIDRHLIRWARINQKLNSPTTTQSPFHVGDITDIFQGSIGSFQPNETCVVLDPPMKGCGKEFLDQLVKFGPRMILYVSCEPRSQVRDLKSLVGMYEIQEVQPFDFFPQSFHIENVVTLVRREECVVVRAD